MSSADDWGVAWPAGETVPHQCQVAAHLELNVEEYLPQHVQGQSGPQYSADAKRVASRNGRTMLSNYCRSLAAAGHAACYARTLLLLLWPISGTSNLASRPTA